MDDGAKAAEALGVLNDATYDLAMAAGRLIAVTNDVPTSDVANARKEALDALRAVKNERAAALKTLQAWRDIHP